MPKYRVTIGWLTRRLQDFEVEADNAGEAGQLAEEMSESEDPSDLEVDEGWTEVAGIEEIE